MTKLNLCCETLKKILEQVGFTIEEIRNNEGTNIAYKIRKKC